MKLISKLFRKTVCPIKLEKKQLYESRKLWTNRRDVYLAKLGAQYYQHRKTNKSLLDEMNCTIVVIDNVSKKINAIQKKLNQLRIQSKKP